MEASAELSFLNCYICFETLKKPKMCPACSKVACEKCLRSWVQQKRPQCPHCRKMMPLSSFAECQRFISDIKHLVKTIDQNQKTKQKCPQHQIQMTYYCQQCEEAICSDCGMFGVKHKGHKITHLKKIYQVYKNKILNQLTHYDQKIQSYRQNGYQIKVEMQKVMMQIGQRKNFIEEYFVAIIERLEEEFKQKQDKISAKYDSNSKQIQFLQSFRENIYRQLQSSTQNQLITKCDEIINYIQSVFDKGPEYQAQQHNFDTIHEIVPKYNQFKYALKNYEGLDENIVYSDPYHNNGIQWRLKIYPKGNGQARQNYLSVFLEMSKGYVNGNKYQYKIELINQKSNKDSVIREYSSNFDIGQCWGYNQFIPIEQLRQQFLTDDGSLVFKVSVRNPSYRSLVRDQQQYIQSLEQKVISLNKSQMMSHSKLGSASSSRKSLKFNGGSQQSFVSNNKMCEQAEQVSRTTKEKLRKFLMAEQQKKLMNQLEREQHELERQQSQLLKFQNLGRNSQDEQEDELMMKIQLQEQINYHKMKKSAQKLNTNMNMKVENEHQQSGGESDEGRMIRKEKKILNIRELQKEKEKIKQNRKKQKQPTGSLSMFDPRSRPYLAQSRQSHQQLFDSSSALSNSIDISSSAAKYYPNFNDHKS